jgi:hypothetical protein
LSDPADIGAASASGESKTGASPSLFAPEVLEIECVRRDDRGEITETALIDLAARHRPIP